MANSYHSINPATALADIKSALDAKYSVTTHYIDSEYFIFSCSALSNKVIKLRFSSSRLLAYYGDAYTSGTTITNQIQFGGYNNGAATDINLVLGDETFLLCAYQGINVKGILIVIGKLSNGKYALGGAAGGSGYSSDFRWANTTDGVALYPSVFSVAFGSASGKLYAQPIILSRADGAVELNGDGSLASFQDISNASAAPGDSTMVLGAGYLLSPAPVYHNGNQIPTSILATY
jgi:hypothetical protein